MAKDALVAHFLNHWKKWAGGIVLLAVAGIIVATFRHRPALAEWLEYTVVMGNSVISPGTRVFRDAMVALTAIIGIVIAVWRAVNLDRQATTGEERLLRDRFATAAELMAKEIAGKPAIAARVNGIYIMEELANKSPEYFLNQTVKGLVAYIKDNAQTTATPPLPEDKTLPDRPRILGEDVKAAFKVLNSVCENGTNKTTGQFPHTFNLDFSYADFSHLDLRETRFAGLNRSKWAYADLSGANLESVDLRGANFMMTRLYGTNLPMANLEGASLRGARLQGANLAFVKTNADTKWDLANLSFASLRDAHLEIKDWSAVLFYATDLSNADINNLTEEGSRRLQGRIWHSGIEALAHIEEHSVNDWNFYACETTSALVGAFNNFGGVWGDADSETRLVGFRNAVAKLGKLPQDFPHRLRQWVESEIKSSPRYG